MDAAISELGSQAAMARLVGVSQPSVWGWVHRLGKLPAEHVLKVEEATGISRHVLRPDIYPQDTKAAPDPTNADRYNGVRA
nr:YdaS family helix-turn-helix protein [Sphingomonas jejuensis]